MTPIRRFALAAAAFLAIGVGPLAEEAAAKHKHGPWCQVEHGRRYDQRNDRYDRYERPRTLRSYDSGKCADIDRRISKARYEIRKNEGTGRHEDALRWFKNDLRKAATERARYCGGRGSDWRWDARDDHRYDRYDRYDDDRYYDSSYDPYGGDRDFELKRDWPSLLGLFMGGGVGAGAGY